MKKITNLLVYVLLAELLAVGGYKLWAQTVTCGVLLNRAPGSGAPFVVSGKGWHDLGAATQLQLSQGVNPPVPICPPDGFGGSGTAFTAGCHNVWQAWNSGAWDDDDEYLLVWGGGHSDYGGNELYTYRIGQVNADLVRLTNPTIPVSASGFGFIPDSGTCLQGAVSPLCNPNSRHTYGGLVYIPTGKYVEAMGGSIAPDGNRVKDMWWLDMTGCKTPVAGVTQTALCTWTRKDACGNGRFNASCSDPNWPDAGSDQSYLNFDPTTGVSFYYSPNGCELAKYNPSSPINARWTVLDSGNCSISGDISTVVDYDARVLLIVGAGGSWSYNIDGPYSLTSRAGALGACSTALNSTGSNGGGPGLAYDPIDKVVVGYPVNGGNTVYLMNMTGFTCTQETQASGPTIPNDGNTRGLRGRFQYMPKEDAFIWAGYPYSHAFALRRREFAASDFTKRCAAAGVLRCDTFDNNSDFVHASNYDTGAYVSDNGQFPTQDTVNRASGKGALHFLVNPSSVFPFSANPAGLYKVNFGIDPSQGTTPKFGENSDLYFQFRWRVSPSALNYFWPDTISGQGWKLFITFGPIPGPSCTGDQFVQENTNQQNIAFAYASCGSPSLVTNNGVPPYLYEQGDYNCAYGGSLTQPNCFVLLGNTWMTEYWHVHTGTFGTGSTRWESWIAAQGQPLKKWLDLTNFTFNSNPDNHTDGFQQIMFQPYFSGATNCIVPSPNPRGTTCPTPQMDMWVDEFIVSTQAIAVPQQ